MAVCKQGRKVVTHDKVRDEIHKMYRKGLHIPADREGSGMYADDNGHRPGDVRVPGGGATNPTWGLL